MVYAKPPFGGPAQVLKYLARYTHRVAISNGRLVDVSDGRVTFRYKDYADGHRSKTMTLRADEFLRRFVQHVLPSGLRQDAPLRLAGQSEAGGEPDAVPTLVSGGDGPSAIA